jgi:hypothetical protein
MVGFIMGEVYLFEEYASHLRKIGVQAITMRVNWNDWNLLRFFEKGFTFLPTSSEWSFSG